MITGGGFHFDSLPLKPNLIPASSSETNPVTLGAIAKANLQALLHRKNANRIYVVYVQKHNAGP